MPKGVENQDVSLGTNYLDASRRATYQDVPMGESKVWDQWDCSSHSRGSSNLRPLFRKEKRANNELSLICP